MSRILWGLTGLFSLLALVAGVVVVSASGGSAERPVKARAWLHAWPEGDEYLELPERFDFEATVTFGESPSSALRIYLHAHGGEGGPPSSAQFIELARESYFLGRIEGGVALYRHEGRWSPGDSVAVEVRRREAELAVIAEGRLLTLASDSVYSNGAIAIGSSGGARARLGRLARLPDLPEFSDDFMRTPEQPSPWDTVRGVWAIDAIPTPSMSANGFSYRGRGDSALTVTGGRMWDRYSFGASARGEPDAAIGLAFAASQSGGHGLFRWTSREADADGFMPAGSGRREIVFLNADGDEEVLASSQGGYIPDQWYRIEVELRFGVAVVSVDGHEVLSAEDPRLVGGKIGLFSSCMTGASFDDILVAPLRKTSMRFGSDQPAPAGPYWEAIGGRWMVGPSGLQLVSRQGLPSAKLLAGSPRWRRYRASLDVATDGPAGLVAAYRDERNYITLNRRPGGLYELGRVKDGTASVLASVTGPQSGPVRLELLSDRGYIAGFIDGRRVLEAWDYDLLQGRLGVWAGGDGAVFEGFSATHLSHAPPLNVVNPTFMQDSFMSSWASGEDEWYESVDGGRKVYWHHWSFRSDVELALDLPADGTGEGRIMLGISKTPDRPQNGYNLEIAHRPEPVARLWREDQVVEEVPIGDGPIASAFIRRQGSFVSAGIDGKPVARFIDPEPLDGSRVAYLVEGVDVPVARARLYGGLFNDYLFNRAPDEWRSAAGMWEVTSRWSCDPRWSFFSGKPVGWPEKWPEEDVLNRPVVTWNKRTFPGDIALEFYVAPIMADRETQLGRQFRRYEYARDFNVSIAADGKDLSSGYTFMFGGFKNTKSAIMRGGVVVAETTDANALMPQNMRIHQRWYRIRVQRNGNELRIEVDFVDRTPVRMVSLVYNDPEPLEGDRLAIWSYGCGITLARLRVASDGEGPMESPDFQPPVRTKTLYDKPEEDAAANGEPAEEGPQS